MRACRPWVGAHGHLRADRRMAHANTVNTVGEQVIRNEFVVAIQVMIADVELNDAVCTRGEATHDFDRLEMMRIQFFESRSNLWLFYNLRQRFVLNLANDFVDELGTM